MNKKKIFLEILNIVECREQWKSMMVHKGKKIGLVTWRTIALIFQH